LNVEQNDFKTISRANTPTKQNPKSEYRKRPADRSKPKGLNPNYEIQNELVWNILIFEHLKLFRISSFEFSSIHPGVLWVFTRVLTFFAADCATEKVVSPMHGLRTVI